MDAIKAGVERHEKLEEIFNRASSVDPEVFEAIKPGVSNDPAFLRALATYHAAVSDLNGILTDQNPKLRTVFEETLRNDGVYEYTSTGSCYGIETYNFRRKPAIAANPSAWESIESIPKGAKYNND